MGAWIETGMSDDEILETAVASYMGAWIETVTATDSTLTYGSRILHGCVD